MVSVATRSQEYRDRARYRPAAPKLEPVNASRSRVLMALAQARGSFGGISSLVTLPRQYRSWGGLRILHKRFVPAVLVAKRQTVAGANRPG